MYGRCKLAGKGLPKQCAANAFYLLRLLTGSFANIVAGFLKVENGCQYHGYGTNRKNESLVNKLTSHGRVFVWLDESRLLYVTDFIKNYPE
jgi:hypothetical protein